MICSVIKIDRIVIPCNKKDYELAKICIASIRYWYPTIPIYLLPDYSRGYLDISELNCLRVELFKTDLRNFGGAFGHWEPFFSKEKYRALVIDADIVLVGKVLETLEKHNEDIVVGNYNIKNPNHLFIDTNYYNFERLSKFDPEFKYPGFVFNAGQFVTNSGLFCRDDFDFLIERKNNRIFKKYPDIFRLTDQGIFNYFIAKQEQQGKITVGKSNFYYWRRNKNVAGLSLNSIKQKKGYPFLIHWSGFKYPSVFFMERSDILRFYQKYYYKHIPYGFIKRVFRNLKMLLKTIMIIWKKRITIFTGKSKFLLKKYLRMIVGDTIYEFFKKRINENSF